MTNMLNFGFDRIPPEILREILYAVFDLWLEAPSANDLINSVKILQHDCEYVVGYRRLYNQLRMVCTKWRDIVGDLPCAFIIVANTATFLPTSRVQYGLDDGKPCECKHPRCQLSNPPPLTSYKFSDKPMGAFLDISPRSERNIGQITAQNPQLWLLAVSVDFCQPTTAFSLPILSISCRRLTHLNFTDFYLPDSTRDQTLDLPALSTLVLTFFCPPESPPPSMTASMIAPMATPMMQSMTALATASAVLGAVHAIRPSFSGWNLPSLRNLALKGWTSDPSPDFVDKVGRILGNVGQTLRGLLYNIWQSEPPRASLHPLPQLLWEWCPNLHTIQTSTRILLAGPAPPQGHPRLTFVPVHLGEIGTIEEVRTLVWPVELFNEFTNSKVWPIDRIRIPTTWGTFYRKLRHLYEANVYLDEGEEINEDADHWPTYFRQWFDILLEREYILEDRYQRSITERSGEALLSWLRGFDEWELVERVQDTGSGEVNTDNLDMDEPMGYFSSDE